MRFPLRTPGVALAPRTVIISTPGTVIVRDVNWVLQPIRLPSSYFIQPLTGKHARPSTAFHRVGLGCVVPRIQTPL